LPSSSFQTLPSADHPEYLQPNPIKFFHYMFGIIRSDLPDAPLSFTEFNEIVNVTCTSCGKTTRISESVYAIVVEPPGTGRQLMTDDIDRLCRSQKSD
jgi:hypothetical protein